MYYQTQDYLMHYGVLGMKWGVRKKQTQSGSRMNRHSNNKKTKYVSKNPTDIALYGHRGANKIKKKMVTKGYTHKQAEKRYVASQIGTSLALGTVTAPIGIAIGLYGPKTVAKAAVNSGKKIANKVINKRMNMAVLDASGKVIKRYRDKGARVVFDMLTG